MVRGRKKLRHAGGPKDALVSLRQPMSQDSLAQGAVSTQAITESCALLYLQDHNLRMYKVWDAAGTMVAGSGWVMSCRL